MKLATEFLKEFYVQRKRKNPSLSVRAFAKKIGIAPGAMSEIFSDKRKLTKKAAHQIANRLNLSLNERKRFLGYFKKSATSIADHQFDFGYRKLEDDEFKSIADWEHYALYTLLDTDDFRSDEAWIAKRLGISTLQTRSVLQRLERLRLVNIREGVIEKAPQRLTTTSDQVSVALRLSHKQALEQAAVALEDIPIELRDITSITCCMDVKRMAEAKQLIKEFRRNFLELMETGEKNEVYQMQICFLPLTKGGIV